MESISKALRVIKDLEKTERGLETIQEIGDKLREMEDIDLINKLETIENQDIVLELKDLVSKNDEKIKLITDAVKILGEKGFTKEGINSKIESLSELSNNIRALQKKMEYMEEKGVSEGELKKLQASVNTIRNETAFMNKEFRDFVGNVKEELDLYERKFNDEVKTIKIFSDYTKEIKNIKNDLFVIKEVNKKLEELVEKGRAKFRMSEDKTRKEIGKLYELYSNLSEIDSKYKRGEMIQKSTEDKFKEIAKLLKQKKIGKDFMEKYKEVYDLDKKLSEEDGKLNQKIEKVNLEVDNLKKLETSNNFLRNEIVSLKKMGDRLKEKINNIESKEEKVVSEISKDEGANEVMENRLNKIVEEKVSLLHKENEVLRSELEQLKKAYFQMMQQREKMPVIIE
jgi:chromosome segregation ATPase